MSKYFVIDPKINHLNNDDIFAIEKEKISKSTQSWERREQKSSNAIRNEIPLKHTVGRVIVVVNTEYKNYTKLNDTTIRLERQYNNLNRRETTPSDQTANTTTNQTGNQNTGTGTTQSHEDKSSLS